MFRLLQSTYSISAIFRSLILSALFFLTTFQAKAQYLVQGKIDFPDTNYTAYLNILNEWDDFGLVAKDLILEKCPIDREGRFQFEGNRLPEETGFYKVHFAHNSSSAVFMDSSPLEKNYFIFLLSNSDSISFFLNQPNFVSGSYKVLSSIPENQTLLDLTIHKDQSEISYTEAKTKSLQDLIIEKRQDHFLNFIDNSEHGLLNLFAVYQTRLPFEEFSEVYRKVADEINIDKYRECYSQSLEHFIGAGSYRDLAEQNTWLRQLLIGSAVLILILLILLIVQLRRKRRPLPIDEEQAGKPLLKGKLTSKETEVIKLMATGITNKEIANQLFVSESTVKTHINNIYRKTGITSREEIAQFVQEHLA